MGCQPSKTEMDLASGALIYDPSHPKMKAATPRVEAAAFSASNWKAWRPSSVQNPPLCRVFSPTQPRKGNRVIKTYGAGDGNRTHVRSLGSFSRRHSAKME